jgi:hypothetical protein
MAGVMNFSQMSASDSFVLSTPRPDLFWPPLGYTVFVLFVTPIIDANFGKHS